jgi:hypothetical protein
MFFFLSITTLIPDFAVLTNTSGISQGLKLKFQGVTKSEYEKEPVGRNAISHDILVQFECSPGDLIMV